MLVQRPYRRPYIPSTPASLPYVGGELEDLTSSTPFWRGQGIPVVQWDQNPSPRVMRCANYSGVAQYEGFLDNLRDRVDTFRTKSQDVVTKAQTVVDKIPGTTSTSTSKPTLPLPQRGMMPFISTSTSTDEKKDGMSPVLRVGLFVGVVAVLSVAVSRVLAK